jgi:hypothetical protein
MQKCTRARNADVVSCKGLVASFRQHRRFCRKVAFLRPNEKITCRKINGLRVSTFLFSVICDRTPQTLTEPDEWLAHIRLFVQPFSVAKGFRLTRIRTWGQPTCRRACWNAAQVYDLRWLRRLSHLTSARRVRCMYR